MNSSADIIKKIKDEEIEYLDLRFTDPRGKLQHVSIIGDGVDEDLLDDGWMFDGSSSIAGWKSIDQSDMKLVPDCSSSYSTHFMQKRHYVSIVMLPNLIQENSIIEIQGQLLLKLRVTLNHVV